MRDFSKLNKRRRKRIKKYTARWLRKSDKRKSAKSNNVTDEEIQAWRKRRRENIKKAVAGTPVLALQAIVGAVKFAIPGDIDDKLLDALVDVVADFVDDEEDEK